MAVGEGGGENRALDAAQAVVDQPPAGHSISGASRILLNVTGGPDLTLYEVSEIAEHVTQAARPTPTSSSARRPPAPEVELRVTLIATGMPDEATAARVRAPHVALALALPLPGEPARPGVPPRDTRDTRELPETEAGPEPPAMAPSRHRGDRYAGRPAVPGRKGRLVFFFFLSPRAGRFAPCTPGAMTPGGVSGRRSQESLTPAGAWGRSPQKSEISRSTGVWERSPRTERASRPA